MERVEEYLEAIYDIQQEKRKAVRTNDLAGKLGIKPSSVTEMLSKLSDSGYIEYQPYYGAVLTEKGLSIAKRIKKFHKIFESFFTDFLGVDYDTAHKLSCELEHHVTEDVAEKICMLIASSECNVCKDCDRSFYILKNAPDGKFEIIAVPKSMEQIGFEVGKVIEKSGEIIFLDEEGYNIEREILSKIVVRVVDLEDKTQKH